MHEYRLLHNAKHSNLSRINKTDFFQQTCMVPCLGVALREIGSSVESVHGEALELVHGELRRIHAW